MTAYLVQLILPGYDNEGTPIERQLFVEVRRELTERFGGRAGPLCQRAGVHARPEHHD